MDQQSYPQPSYPQANYPQPSYLDRPHPGSSDQDGISYPVPPRALDPDTEPEPVHEHVIELQPNAGQPASTGYRPPAANPQSAAYSATGASDVGELIFSSQLNGSSELHGSSELNGSSDPITPAAHSTDELGAGSAGLGLPEPPPAPAPVRDPHPQHATDWTYQPRTDHGPAKPAPAEWGWRARVRELSGGLIKLAPADAELAHRAAVDMIRTTLPGSRTVAVANEKGGAGKTPTALILSALLAEYRREAVVAWDVNELRGTLGRRAQVSEPPLTVTDVLAAAGELARPDAEVAALRAFLRRQPEGNLVLASSEDGNAMRQIGHRECDIVRQLLLRRFGIVVCDTGNNAAAPNFLYTVDSADVLVLPTAPSDVHLDVARAMLRMLASRETTSHLVERAVLVVTSSTGARLEPEEERWFADRIGRVVHVPADPAIAEGSKLAVSALSEQSRRAWTEVASAVVAAALAPSRHDKPVGRRRAPEPAEPGKGSGAPGWLALGQPPAQD